MLDIFELESHIFESAVEKNGLIRTSNREWIGFIDSSVTNAEEINSILDEMQSLREYDAILFGDNCLEGEIGLLDLLEYPNMTLYAFLFRREILVKTGSFNQYLNGNINFEFLLRVAEWGRVYVISCCAEKNTVIDAFAMAYILRRYMLRLKTDGRLEDFFIHMNRLSDKHGVSVEFANVLNRFMSNSEEYEQIDRSTAPILIFVGDDTCAGVLAGFANSLADELVKLGQAVITTNNRYGNYRDIPTNILLNQNYKAIIGFQAPALNKDFAKSMKGKRIQFMLDNPAFSMDFFEEDSKDIYFLCQDGYYAEYIKEYYKFPRAIQFPPGGTVVNNLPCEKQYDIVFIGNYEIFPEYPYKNEYEKGFFEYMIRHPDSTFEAGLFEYGKMLRYKYAKCDICQLLHDMKELCIYILHRDRHIIIEQILSSGIQLHVFSDSWKRYRGNGKENLVIHPMVFGEEPYRVWAQSKIGLNIMRGHKAGMTERVANIMLCGACCLSDETVYLAEHFKDGEELVLFNRRELYSLPEKIKYLLSHDKEREKIALAGQKRAFEELTWKKRAEELLAMLDE